MEVAVVTREMTSQLAHLDAHKCQLAVYSDTSAITDLTGHDLYSFD